MAQSGAVVHNATVRLGQRFQAIGSGRLTRQATDLVSLQCLFRETAEAMAKRKRAPKITKQQFSKSPYFMQPGKRGMVVVLHRACGNRVVPKVCGVMPSRAHAKMLIGQLEKAESAVKDLFLEATDDGIEALEAVLAACCEEVLRRGPKVHESEGGGAPGGGGSGARPARGRRGRHGRGGPRPEHRPSAVTPLPVEQRDPDSDERGSSPYNEAAG